MGKRESYRRISSAFHCGWGVFLLTLLALCYCLSANAARPDNRIIPKIPKASPHTITSNNTISVDTRADKNKNGNQRLHEWQLFIQNNRGKPSRELVALVNAYFNRLSFIEDVNLWRQDDYWATPYEVLREGAGDCEDHAIAKYFTLRSLGIPNEQLQIAFVRVKRKVTDNNETIANLKSGEHMVLLYIPPRVGSQDDNQALVLDNLSDRIVTISDSIDYELGYSFNSEKVWVWKDNTQAIVYGGPGIIENWRKLQERYAKQLPTVTASVN